MALQQRLGVAADGSLLSAFISALIKIFGKRN